MNSNGGSPTPESMIPGWRVILSDAGRLWASRETPFPRETEWHAPPYRTVDADTLDELRAEVERQEQAARDLKTTRDSEATGNLEAAGNLEATHGQGAERSGTAGRTATPDAQQTPPRAASGQAGQ
ncbi:hypothetical protein GCM10017673_28920 [Streptosporangium violaceochromogenes]|nr:hypothetical protein GCM10017673_28920 [Streptosporangium violaceochromogenes]